jgi:16S rRNA (guanine527-N7)-methyltransferase
MTITNSNVLDLPDAAVRDGLALFGVPCSPVLNAAIRKYVALFLRWNQKVSLTSVTDAREIVARHFGESMFAAGAVPITKGRLVDVGSGAGFPGLALKLIVPELEVVLFEASAKKAVFLAEVVRELKLDRVKIVSRRAEEHRELEGSCDFVTCRAVRIDKRLLAWMGKTLRAQGRCVLWLGESDAVLLRKNPNWDWSPPIKIPMSENRVLQVGTPQQN